MSNLEEVGRTGTATIGKSMVPTVTNLNVTSILTGKFPLDHGITGNFYFDKLSRSEVYMDSPKFLRCNTLLEEASKKGLKTLFLTVKEKLKRLLCRGATTSFSVESPPKSITQRFGRPPDIYSPDSTIWLLDTSLKILKKASCDLVCIATTDYVPHKYGPKSVEAKEYMEKIDDKIGLFIEEDVIFGLIADHGMNDKHVKIDLEKALSEEGVLARAISVIKDEYVRHHQNLGGAAYLYFEGDFNKPINILRELDGVESVLVKDEAKSKYMLPPDRIGDLLVLGVKGVVFGPVKRGLYEDVQLRSHGSLYEREIPFITNQRIDAVDNVFNKDAFRYLRQKS